MPKNIVICCDGTNNQFGVCNTNVVRIAQLVARDPTRQLCYYDPGVGTLPEQGLMTRVGQTISRWMALAFATDINDKVITAYAHLMEVWEPGDQVFLFGFSRGAYTARMLAAVLHAVGLLPRGNTQLLPYVMRLYGALRHGSSEDYWHVLNSFRQTFARQIPGRNDAHFPIHFLGVWDTVSSVGWVWNPPAYPFTARLPNVAIVRHAVAIDERRWFFRQNLITPQPGQDTKEFWFAGVHSDIGGGYPEDEGGLWRIAFEWILAEARAAGLLIDEARLAHVRGRSPVPANPWAEPQHESLTGMWWIGEVVPKLVYDPVTNRQRPAIGLGGHRTVHAGALLDASAVERLHGTPYRPPNLSDGFIASVAHLDPVPATVPYTG
ncbi:MAG: T6SS phospholipase effector Tle1-like catalytic domain-containing protein [Gemmatimonadaceae bacterium]